VEASPVSPAVVHEQLERMLSSATFRGAERSRRLLSFIVEEALQGRADRLKDYTLGSEALGRGEHFDPRSDPIARVEASRLRSRLEMYYATEGSSDPVRISLPRGGYVPVFEMHLLPTVVATAPAPGDEPGIQGFSFLKGRHASQLVAGIAAAVALASLVGMWFVTRNVTGVAPAAELRSEIVTPPTTDSVSLAVAPDGRSIAFVATVDGRSRLWIRRLDSETPRELAGTDHATLPFWSPDGRSIGFFADGKIKRIDLETGLVHVMSTALVPAGAAWNRDGVILHPLVPDSPLFRTSVAGAPLEPATQLAEGQLGHRGPAFLPDDEHFLFYATGKAEAKGIFVGELGAGAIRRLIDADGPAVFAAPDRLFYVQHASLFVQRLDMRTITLVGDPILLAEGLTIEPLAGVAALAAAADTVVYRRGSAAIKRQFIWFDRTGREVSRIGSPAALGPSYASLSPDGRRVAVQRSRDGNTDIVIVDLERGTPVQLTTEPQPDIAPVWSPRGDRIVYASPVDGVFHLMEKALDGTPAHSLLETPQSKQATDWSRDGRYLLFRTIAFAPNVDIDIWALSLEGDRKPFPVVRTPFEERDAQFSPDGQWIAYHSNESGQHEVYVRPFPGPGEPERLSTDGGVQARWRGDGRELFYLTFDGTLVAVPVTLRPDDRSLKPGTGAPLFQARVGATQGIPLHSYIVTTDGQRFLIETVIEEAPAPISLILNWRPPGE
jgi:Tol biopolymer transport system component